MLYNNPDLEAFAQAVQAENPDIVGLQEVSDRNTRFIESRLASTYPYRVLEPQAELNGVAC